MVSEQERAWLRRIAIILLFAFALPVLYAWLHPPDGWQLYRSWCYGGDYTQYRSAMQQGYDGAWLIVDRFTPEPHRPILQYPLYVLLGHVARRLHLPLEVPYVLTSALAMVILVYALYYFGATFLQRPQDRKLAFWLTMSVGPAWLISALQLLLPAADFLLRYDNAFNRPEVNTFLLLNAAPHLPLALAILLYVLAAQWKRSSQSTARFIGTYILLPLSLGLLNSFSLPPLLLLSGLLALWRTGQEKRLSWRDWLPPVTITLAVTPLVVYNLWAFTRDPFWGQAYGSQNYQISFPPDVVLLGYGVMGGLALVGAGRLWRNKPRQRLLIIWGATLYLIGYIPVPYQRRFSLGLGPLLAVLAVSGWRTLARTRTVRRWRHRMIGRVLGSAALILLLWGQQLIFYAAYSESYLGTGPAPRAVFQPTALARAAQYLDATDKSAVILTCEDLGNTLAGEIHGRVVLGHAGATLHVTRRRQEVQAFFNGEMSLETQRQFLQRHHVTHILASTINPLTCGETYTPPSAWEKVYQRDGITIWAQSP